MAFTDLRSKTTVSTNQSRSGWQSAIAIISSLFLVTIPFVFTWVNEELFEVPKMLYTYAFVIILAALWGFRMIFERRVIFRRTFLDIPILLFLLSQALSTIFSMHPQTSLPGYYSRLNGGLLSTLAYITIYYVIVSNLSWTQVKKALKSSIIASLIVSVYGILEHFGRSFSCLIITGNFGVKCWQQNVQDRVFATFGQPNWLAAYAVTLIPLTLAFLARFKKNSKKISTVLLGVATVLLFVVLIFTGSRSGLIAVGLGIFLVVLGGGLIFFTDREKSKNKSLRPYFPIFITLIAIAIAALIFGTRYTPSASQILARFQAPAPATTTNVTPATAASASAQVVQTRPFDGDISNDTGEIRKIVWRGAVDIWKRYPILGSGVETFAYSYYLDRPMEHNAMFEWDYLYNKAHNEFLNYLATTGLFGLGTYLLIFGVFTVFIIRYTVSDKLEKSQRLILVGLWAGTVSLAVSNFFGFSTVVCQILQFTFLATASLIIATANPKKTQNETQIKAYLGALARWQYALCCIVTIAALFGLNRVGNYWYADYLYARGKSAIARGKSQEGLQDIQRAADLRPGEALYINDLSDFLSQLAVAYQQGQQPELTELAAATRDQALLYLEKVRALNPVHLNFFKTRTRIYTALAVFDPQFLKLAKENLEETMALAPTDPKLVYTYATLLATLGDEVGSETALRQALTMRPGYHEVRKALARLEEERSNYDLALEHYRYILERIAPNDEQAKEALSRLTTATLTTATESAHD